MEKDKENIKKEKETDEINDPKNMDEVSDYVTFYVSTDIPFSTINDF